MASKNNTIIINNLLKEFSAEELRCVKRTLYLYIIFSFLTNTHTDTLRIFNNLKFLENYEKQI